jgi:alpha-1,6-mannosyltransferase
MKVIDVTEFYSIRGGGVRSHLTEKGHVSCQLGHEHWVVAPGPKNRLIRAAHAESTEGRSYILHVGGPALPYDPTYHLFWRGDAVHRLVREQRPDVLEIHSPYLAAASALTVPRSRFGVRTFVWHADFIDTYLRGSLERRLSARSADRIVEPLWAWVRTIARGCDATFAASRWQADKLRSHGVERVIHLPFGVDKQAFTPERRSDAVRRELLGKRQGPLLLAIGRFAVEKRWDVVLGAFEALRAPGAVLAIFGDGPEAAAMKARMAGRDDVIFFGFERDRGRLAGILASGDALIHGCPFETFGLGIAEAVSAGLPIVVPREGGAYEQAREGASETYETGDARGCAAAVERLLARPSSELRARALAAAAEVPSAESHFRALFDHYQSLLNERRST